MKIVSHCGPLLRRAGGDGAQEKTRTSTTLRPLAPEASASTNSATWALGESGTAAQGRCQAVSKLGVQNGALKPDGARMVRQAISLAQAEHV